MYSVDFLPERIRNQRARRRRLIRLSYLLVVVILGLGTRWYFARSWVRSADARSQMLDESWRNLMQQEVRRQDLEKQLSDLMVKKQIEVHLGSRVSAQLLLAELQHQLPASIVLLEFEMQGKSASLQGERVSARAAAAGQNPIISREADKRVHVTIRGLAPTDVDVANFIGQLSVSPLLEQVRMGYARNVVVDGRLAREFEASFQVVR